MNCIHPCALRDVDYQISTQIRFGCRCWAEQISLVAFEHVQTGAICLGIHCDRADTKLSASATDAQGDLATVRNENLFEGGQ